MTRVRAFTLISLLAAVIFGGMVFFRIVEGWSWVDAYFFTVVTLSTVGYGNLVPQTELGKIGTTIFIFVGLGIFALVIQQIGSFAVLRREVRRQARRAAKAEVQAELEAEFGIEPEAENHDAKNADGDPPR